MEIRAGAKAPALSGKRGKSEGKEGEMSKNVEKLGDNFWEKMVILSCAECLIMIHYRWLIEEYPGKGTYNNCCVVSREEL